MPESEIKYRILYIDDEPSNLKSFKATFKWDYEILLANSAREGLETLSSEEVDLIIADQRMPEMTGFEFFKSILADYPDPIRIILTGYSDMDILIRAINECGIYQYLTKPWNEQGMKHALDKALETYQLRKDNKRLIEDLREANESLVAQNEYLQEEIQLHHNFNEIITSSDKVKQILNKIEKVAPAKTSVLIQGESGTGKELMARAIHNISNRSEYPLIKVNCAALSADIIESELFGHEKGAFTGAVNMRRGRFELADKGTIFLDEVGELSLEIQSKLLRVLQEQEFERLGSERSIKVDVRIIAATNKNLEEAIKNGSFREDLYYRLNVFPISCPPLRERKEDIPLLVQHFLIKYEPIIGVKLDKVSPAVIKKLEKYDWPGNIRELENVIERSMITSSGNTLEIDDPLSVKVKSEDRLSSLKESEIKHIKKALELSNGRVSGKDGAAALLDINPKTLYWKISKYNIK
ncbi:MAG: sigma-54 dependent transcriptional regulator [Ekhidna sp.]